MTQLKPELTRRGMLALGVAGTALAAGGRAGLAALPGTRPDIASPAGQRMIDLYGRAVAAMQAKAINDPPQPQSWTFQAHVHGVPQNDADPVNSPGMHNGSAALKARIDAIYGNPAAGTPQAGWKQAALACWGTCTHASAVFVSWHRWYLYYFERVCRRASGAADFMLPYWDYASDQGASLQLPAAFRNRSGPLFFADRGLGFGNPRGTGSQTVAMNQGGYMPFAQTDYSPALAMRAIFPSDQGYVDPSSAAFRKLGFAGRLEVMPHDNVHDNVGGWMSNPPAAAADPLFYVHHGQVDRLWASWEAEAGSAYNWGASATQPGQAAWAGRVAAFVDEAGKLVHVKLGQSVDTKALGYVYDKLATAPALIASAAPAPVRPPAMRLRSAPRASARGSGASSAPEAGSSAPPAAAAEATPAIAVAAMQSGEVHVTSGGAQVTLTPRPPEPLLGAPAPAPTGRRLRAPRPGAAPLAGAAPAAEEAQPATLVLEGVKLLRRPPAPLHVFLNLPNGTTPQLDDLFHVGMINLFNFDTGTGDMMVDPGPGSAMHAMPDAAAGRIAFDVHSVLAAQRAAGVWSGGPVTVTVTTLGADTSTGVTYVTIGKISLVP